MKKLILFLCLLMALPMTAQKKTFKVACLNVDGLPPSVKAVGIVDVNLNPEGPQEEGTLQMSKLVSQKGWDFFGVSENFNYNTQLMSELKGVYNYGTFRGEIPSNVTNVVPYLAGNKWFDTDGLNLLWRSTISVSNEAWYLWNKRNGITSDGSDQLIAKGFRYYTVKVAPGLELDVYILHMDAETTDADNEAREVQMNQLVDMILASDNKRPILIMGDTNCRYTRDNIKGLMFDRINADPRFEMHDPWIDFPRKGVMPNIGDPALMVPKPFDGTNHEAFQTGEVVDKIFYINNTDATGVTLTAKSYLQDTDFTWPNGSEISDHYPIVIEFEMENTGEAITNGEYYIRNIQTGEFIAAGANYGTRAIVGRTGNRITLEPTGVDNEFYIRTTLSTLGSNLYMDASEEYHVPFVFNRIDGTQLYTITLNGRALTVDNNKLVQTTDINIEDSAQQWELITPQKLIEILRKEASESNPMDATFMIKGANFSRNDTDNDAWNHDNTGKNTEAKFWRSDNSGEFGRQENFVAEYYHGVISTGSNGAWTLKQSISNLPNGKYKLTFNGFKREGQAKVTINNKDYEIKNIGDEYTENPLGDNSVNSYVQESKGVISNKKETINFNGYVPNGMNGASDYFNAGYYINTIDNIIIDNGSLDITISKGSNTSMTWTVIDNFILTYYGPTAEVLESLDRVKEAIDDAKNKAEKMHLTTYDNRAVEDAWENRLITGDGTKEIHNTYLALAKAATKQYQIPADMRYTILNNSFEMGNISEWNASAANNARVIEDSSVDGKYIMTADGGALTYDFEVTMPRGMYELKAYLSKGAVLTAGDRQSSPSSAENGSFEEVSIKFIILNGTETIGVKCDEAFSADNFTITRVGDQENATSYEIVKLAMKDATEKVNLMGEPYNQEWNLSKYQELIDNFAIEGDGMKEFNEIYDLLREKVYSQENTAGVSYTYAIINPSFEFGNTLGWDATFAGDTGVKENSNSTYTMSGCDGTYLFNTWQDGRGTILSQTIPNLPSGHYRLRATVAADQGSYVYFEANGQKSEAIKIERAKENGQVVSFDFDVAANTPEVTISIRGGNSDGSYDDFGGNWYKVDKFELTRHGDQKVCFFYDRLQKAIDRTNQIAAKLPEKYRNQWDPSDYRDLYDKHIESGHVADPMNGSNGLAEIEELYSRLRKLIFSQTEIGANMSGAITNQSFELGDFTSWTINMDPVADTKVTKGNLEDTYKTEGLDGDYLCNSWINGKSAPLSQVIKGVPSGKYRLSAKVASDAGNRFFLAVDNVPGEMLSTSNGGIFDSISVNFEITEDSKDILIGLYPTPNGEFDPDLNPVVMGPWFKADNFELTFLGREQTITWTMEGSKYDTIILPFGVESEDMPENLYFYSVNEFDWNNGTESYHVLALGGEESSINANTPYVVMRAEVESTTRSVEMIDENTYNFTGIPVATDETEHHHGLLTGVLVETAVDAEHYTIAHDGETSSFTKTGGLVNANHAYIQSDKATAPVIYFEAPENIDTGVENIAADDRLVDVFTTTGIKIRRNVTAAKALDGLDPGIYILSDGSRICKTTSK